MRTRLTRIGDDVALPLDRALLEQLDLDEHSEVELSVERGVLVVEPVGASARDRSFRESVKKMDEQYAGVFQRLAE